jgi:hypothetical protein
MWGVIILATVGSFVYWGAGTSRYNDRAGGENLGSISGERIGREDFVKAYREVLLDFFLQTGEWPDREAGREKYLNQRTYFRLFLVRKLDELNIQVSSETVAQTASDLLRSIGRGQPVPLDQFVGRFLLPHGVDANDFARFLRHQIGIQQLSGALGLSGRLVTPHEARALYQREHQELSAQAVFFSASNHLANVTAKPEDVAAFFTSRMPDYRVPERVQVSYVKFDLTNFLAEADQGLAKMTNLTQEIENIYRERGTNYYRDARSPEEAKEKIRHEMRQKLAAEAATRKAVEFATPILERDPPNVEELEKAAKERGLSSGVPLPFTRQLGPAELDVSDNFAEAAFKLTPETPFSRPIVSGDAVYVMALKRRLPSEVPPFEQVRERVTSDYKYYQAVLQARGDGTNFIAALTNGLAQGKAFAAICAEAKVKPVLLPPFSISTRSLPEAETHIQLAQLKEVAFSTPPGKASGLIPTREGSMVLFVQSQLPLDETKLKAELPTFIRQVRQTRQNEAFEQWFNQEARKALRDTPAMREQPPQMRDAPAT